MCINLVIKFFRDGVYFFFVFTRKIVFSQSITQDDDCRNKAVKQSGRELNGQRKILNVFTVDLKIINLEDKGKYDAKKIMEKSSNSKFGSNIRKFYNLARQDI